MLVIGAGPAGSTAALKLLEFGIRPLVLEREQFPRYHIGESMTGECAAMLRGLGLGGVMDDGRFPVKHGVRIFGTSGRPDWWVPVMNRTDDLALEPQSAPQVRRSEFDHLLLDAAVARGAEVVHGRATEPIVDDRSGRVTGARVRLADGSERSVGARITLDCSGQATFLANRKVTGPKYLGAYDKQIAVFSQVAGYERDGGGAEGEAAEQPGNTHIFYKAKYHWAWAIPISDDVTSVGVVLPAEHFRARREAKAEFLARELRELNPGLAERAGGAEFVHETRVIPNYSFQVDGFAGPGFLSVGDAHRFVDPIFSFGLLIAVKEAHLAAAVAAAELAEAADPSRLRDHVVRCERAVDVFEDMIDTFWENPLAFSVFAHSRYRSPLIDMFAGRVYGDRPTDGLERAAGAFRRLLGRTRDYEDGLDRLSVPIGSRFDPGRAPLWDSLLDSVETTEAWMREK